MIQKVIILGGGSAGLLTAVALKTRLPALQVDVIRSLKMGVIGVGEGSDLSVTRFLHGYLNIDPAPFFTQVRPTWKLGLKFIWGKRPSFNYTFGPHLTAPVDGLPRAPGFYCRETMAYECEASALMDHDRAFVRGRGGTPVFHDHFAYHFENAQFVAYLERLAASRGVALHDDVLEHVKQDASGMTGLALASGQTRSADLYVDCSGFESLLLGKAMGEPFLSYAPSLFCDRAVVGGWMRSDEPIRPYTTCETMNAGWCWQIEHEQRINRGYVYSSSFISDDDARHEFIAANSRVSQTRIVRFITGRYERAWVKNVVAIGNAAGFVEPLEASALGCICTRAMRLADMLLSTGGQIPASQIGLFNRENGRHWDSIRDFLAVHYRFNERLDTPFWREARASVDLAGAQPIVEYFQDSGPNPYWGGALFGPFEAFGLPGYFAMLVGQQVKYAPPTPISDDEWRVWTQFCAKQKAAALSAMTVNQTLETVASPQWRWK